MHNPRDHIGVAISGEYVEAPLFDHQLAPMRECRIQLSVAQVAVLQETQIARRGRACLALDR